MVIVGVKVRESNGVVWGDRAFVLRGMSVNVSEGNMCANKV